jgi:hypothetical protein
MKIQSVNPLTRIAEATGPANSPAKQADRNESFIAWLLYVHGISGAFFPFQVEVNSVTFFFVLATCGYFSFS